MIQRFDYENVFSQEAPKRDIAQKEIRMIQMVHNYARVLEATKGKILSLDLIRTLEQLINRYHSNSPRMTLDVKEEVIDGIYMSFFPKRPMG